MDGYKKVIKSRKVRFLILKILSFVPTSVMLRIQYRIKLKRKLNLKNPRRFTEQIQIYKMKYRNPIMKKCVDKYEVRSYIESLGIKDILVKNYGVFESYEDIDFSILPEKFVVKSTSGGGGNNVVIVKDKNNIDLMDIKSKIGQLGGRIPKNFGGREWAYYGLKNKLIVEEYLENHSNPEGGIDDYKFFCFNGKPIYYVVDHNRFVNHQRNFYDISGKFLDVNTDHQNLGDVLLKPKNFDRMVEISKVLSKEFPFVRVDLYNVEGEIRFGELTFYPWSGYVPFSPDSFDFEFPDIEY